MEQWRQHPASEKQTRLLRGLAQERGLTYERPRNAGHASDQIGQLLHARRPDLDNPYPNPNRRTVHNLNRIRQGLMAETPKPARARRAAAPATRRNHDATLGDSTRRVLREPVAYA